MSEPTTSGQIRIRSGQRELSVTGDLITIGDAVFRLSYVDHVVYRAAVLAHQASYTIGLGKGDTKRRFTFDAYRRGTELDDYRSCYERLVAMIEDQACPRLAETAFQTISAGGKVIFGAWPSARIEADATGLRPLWPFTRTVPWDRIARADLHRGQARVWTEGDRK